MATITLRSAIIATEKIITSLDIVLGRFYVTEI